MLSGIMLIVVTMFAVLGAYYVSEMLTRCLLRRRKLQNAVVLLAAHSPEEMWNGVLDVRAKLPESAVVVLCAQELELHRLEPSMKGVVFATPDTLGEVVCAQLAMPAGDEAAPCGQKTARRAEE